MDQLDKTNLPRHIAIIMDGNGRWARNHSLGRIAGHRKGTESVRSIVEACRRIGIPYLTLYAFSSENWSRPDKEVNALMTLLERYLKSELKTMTKNNIRLLAIGETGALPSRVRRTWPARGVPGGGMRKPKSTVRSPFESALLSSAAWKPVSELASTGALS